jgi:hypothetical protein
MKKLETLGKVLSKEEQKKIKGGPVDPDNPCKTGACTDDSQCGHADCICGTTVIDPNPKCHWLT